MGFSIATYRLSKFIDLTLSKYSIIEFLQISLHIFVITMRQASAIFFLLIYIYAGTELHQLVRLPVFIAHFKEHKNLNNSLNLLDFIELHYFKSEHSDKTHEELPFNNNDCVAAALSLVILPDNSSETLSNVVGAFQAPILYSDLDFKSPIHFSIWQPPRA